MSLFQQHVALLRSLLDGEFGSVCARLAVWNEADWQAWVAFLYEHRLRACFGYYSERDERLQACIPAGVRKKLDRSLAIQREKVAALGALRVRAGELLDAEGIGYLVLKGETLAGRFYPRGQERAQGDVDLLVREADVPRTVRLLQSLDLKLRGEKTAIASHRIRAEHATTLSNGDLSIDLHWKLRSGPDYRISLDGIWATRQWVPCAAGRVATLSDEYLLVMLCVSLAHDLGRGGVRLKSFLDLHYLLRSLGRLLESETFWRRRCEEGIETVCRQTLAVVEAILPGSVPAGLAPVDDVIRARAWILAASPRGAIDNALWLARLHRLWRPGHLWWFLRKQVSHPGRLPVCAYRLARFTGRLAVWAATPTARDDANEDDSLGRAA